MHTFIARESDYQLVADPDSLKGAHAPSLAGAYTVEEAVPALLAPSGLTAEIRDRTITLRGRDAPSREEVTGATDLQLSVTGSRIRGAKPTSPVISVSREQIAELGHSDLGSFARSIPQNFNGGQNPGVVTSLQAGSENATSSSALNLRGLGPDATLTLFNGHRVAYDAVSQGIDISAIPMAAIDRVEIVADGASALYGSDAVGGVANIILRRDSDGLETSLRIGGATEGGAFQQQYSAVTGRRWRGGGFMIAGDFNKASDISASQRSFTRSVNPELTIYPSNRQWSAVFAGHQALGEVVEFELDAHYNRHKSRIGVPSSGTAALVQNGIVGQPDIESYSVSPSVTFRLPAGWEMTARATYASSNSHIMVDLFSGGSLSAVNNVRYKNDLWSAEFSAEGQLFAMPGGDARLAMGAGLRSNGLTAFSFRTTGATVRTLLSYSDSQTAIYSYGELFLPLVSDANASPLLRSLQLTGAVRYERYDEIGGLATPKVGLTYQPLSALTLKGSWGKSFKAPTLSQMNIVRQGVLISPTLYLPSPPSNRAVLQLSGGNKALEPETANALTLTAEFKPPKIPGFKAEASVFDVRYKNRVIRPIADSTQSFRSEYADLIIVNPSLEQVLAATANLPLGVQNQTGSLYDPANIAAIVNTGFQNAARQHIRGIDASISYGFSRKSDAFSLEGSASYLESDQRLSANQPVIQQAGTIFRPPHWRGRAGGSWQHGSTTLTLAYNYIGGTKDERTATTYKVDAFHTVDTTIAWKPRGKDMWSDWSFLLAGQNILNAHPSLIRTSSGAAPNYDATNYSAVGRTISLTVSKAW
ncbi:TonB-dependent receptor [Sphingobium sp. YR768]|uniref:TonB-dependent receptor n=1 Tax=Sphingobium sp. YR768 TaxID=1884365 RepID=UPI0008AB9101|nr:TonB-dependent receptor [Sphingobium sp. YR768]SES20832.1 Outer membrane receptor for ferrienterochelin and colicins [Sphingobium sp. YR768]